MPGSANKCVSIETSYVKAYKGDRLLTGLYVDAEAGEELFVPLAHLRVCELDRCCGVALLEALITVSLVKALSVALD